MKLFIVFYIIFSVLSHALPHAINEMIHTSTIAKKDLSIYIKEVGNDGDVVVSHNIQKQRTPASVVKVLTTYAALLKLGFDYKIPTKFYTTGKLRKGVLYGDLIVKGFGDPTLKDKDLIKITQRIKKSGIRKINGNIIIDRSYFRVGTRDNSGFDENLYSPYNAMPDAMMFNERISTICVEPNRDKVFKQSPDSSYKILNQLQRVNKPCRGKYSWPVVRIDKSSNTPSVLLQGKISKKCGKRNICKVITKPYKSFYHALRSQLNKVGVPVKGHMRLRKVPSDAKPLLIHYSERLEKIIAKTAKKSNNLYARHLLLILGAKIYNAPATLSKGRRAVESILIRNRAINKNKLVIDNGSGLSRWAKLSAKLLANMYDHAHTKYDKRWMHTLSIAGVDGTIKKRFRGSSVANRAWMKTGTLNRVKNIGGYVKSKSGKLYTVVILVNTNRGNWRAAALQNKIIKWLVNYKGQTRQVITVENTKLNELMQIPNEKEDGLY